MDSPPAVAYFHPDRRFTWAAAAGALVAVCVAVITSDSSGRLLVGVAALVLLAYVVTDLVFAPRLALSAEGVVINTPLTRVRLAWSQIEDIRADSRLRLGLRSTTLEVDAGAVLAVFSRRAIGADPEAVAELARAYRPA